jgi:hypothetical protein
MTTATRARRGEPERAVTRRPANPARTPAALDRRPILHAFAATSYAGGPAPRYPSTADADAIVGPPKDAGR